jgi:hypothetical protein
VDSIHGRATVDARIILTTPAAERLKLQTLPSVELAPCREQSGRAVLDSQLDVSDFGAHSRPEKPPHQLPAMHAALQRVPRCFTGSSAVPRACPYSAGVSVEGVPSVSKHLQLALALHRAQRAIQACLVRADALSAAARRPRVAGSFGVPPADVLWSRFRGVRQGRQCPRPARGAARRGLWVTPERVESPPPTTTAADLRRSTTIDAARSRRRPTGRRYLRPPSPADADDVARRPPPPRSSL